jgi:hypothetical protein
MPERATQAIKLPDEHDVAPALMYVGEQFIQRRTRVFASRDAAVNILPHNLPAATPRIFA